MKIMGRKIDGYDISIVSKRILAIFMLILLSTVFFLKAFKLW